MLRAFENSVHVVLLNLVFGFYLGFSRSPLRCAKIDNGMKITLSIVTSLTSDDDKTILIQIPYEP